METGIKVVILNRNCWSGDKKMALAANSEDRLVLTEEKEGDPNQQWLLIPNLAIGAKAGGYTLYNIGKGRSARQPAAGAQIPLDDDPTPYGNQHYSWTIFAADAQVDNQQEWYFQSYERGDLMDAWGKSCKEGTAVKFYRWVGTNNQRWVIKKI
jgi:hypothetical protein